LSEPMVSNAAVPESSPTMLARIFHEEAVLVSFCSSLEFVEA